MLVPAAALGPVALAAPGVQQVPLSGTGAPQTGAYTPSGPGDVTTIEFPSGMKGDAGPAAYDGKIVARSLSRKSEGGNGGGGGDTDSHERATSSPAFKIGWEGLNFFQQRYARGGNQFSVEPPDQALCVGNGYVFEAVNDVVNVYNTSGRSLLPDTNVVNGVPTSVNGAVDLNSFFGYAPAINRSTGIRGPFVTDPTCLYDAATQRFFVVVLTLETVPATGAFTLSNHLDIAVSKTANATGGWNIYRLNVTADGTNPDPSNACPCLGDYPHIGADANGFYITTNAYPWNGNGFSGAQIYAFSKAQLAAGAAAVTMQHIDTFGTVNAPSDAGPKQPGFTVWPAQSPGSPRAERDFNKASEGEGNRGRGVEYFLSSNAGDEATRPIAGSGGPHLSNQLIVWALTNTASLNSATPALSLSNTILSVQKYAIPPLQKQPGSGTRATTATPQGNCINDTITLLFNGQIGCWRLLFGKEPAHDEVISKPDSNDTRMQQVMYADGKLWGALDTALTVSGGGNRAGIAWYVVEPQISDGAVEADLVNQGYLGAAGHDLTYPAIGVTASGRGVMAFTATGDALNPSAAFAPIDARGVGAWSVVRGGLGAAQDDGFTGYKAQVGNPPRTRWGDYGAAAVDGSSIWIASEYIAHACDYRTWGGPFFFGGTGDNKLGTCAPTTGAPGTRGALGNWSTRISQLVP
ncbi:MAG TPA: hypothetical protein VGQ62_20455 [Chloroflexota bacterium]|jgi:hypothetical protein|nr:hypothetical protein [Chloroflexota bacterium]